MMRYEGKKYTREEFVEMLVMKCLKENIRLTNFVIGADWPHHNLVAKGVNVSKDDEWEISRLNVNNHEFISQNAKLALRAIEKYMEEREFKKEILSECVEWKLEQEQLKAIKILTENDKLTDELYDEICRAKTIETVTENPRIYTRAIPLKEMFPLKERSRFSQFFQNITGR